MNSPVLRQLTEFLWPVGHHLHGPQLYWLLDGACDPAIATMVRLGRLEYTCLYTGMLHHRLHAAAPYLVHLAANSPTTNLPLQRGCGNAWGMLVEAPAGVTLLQLRLDFKKFLHVQTEDGTQLAFQYYDRGAAFNETFHPEKVDDETRAEIIEVTAEIIRPALRQKT